MHKLAKLDHRYIWHPFTQMRDWLKREPIIITEAKGAVLRDIHGREYLDANASIWTNIHGHNHPAINAALTKQLRKISHSSALGFANEPSPLVAEKLVKLANPRPVKPFSARRVSAPALTKVFFSDNGSTAMEVALKLAYEFTRRTGNRRPRFLSLEGAYHGDTVGAVALGHIDLFHKAYSGLLFDTDTAPAPYCYRCKFNRARPERADARDYRRCKWECVSALESQFARRKKTGNGYAAFVFEPLLQGAAGIIPQPTGWLGQASAIAREHGALLIADEVMTGFGRVSAGEDLFGSHVERVQPDFMALAKGLTGGYLPMAATLTTQAVFDAFLGDYSEFKTFFHGHSFTGNQLGSAAALASLRLLETTESIRARRSLQSILRTESQNLWGIEQVGDIRQVGCVVGVELVRNWRTRESFALEERAGIRVCEAMAERGVLTRPVGNVLVVMPPFCTTRRQVEKIFSVMHDSINQVLAP